MAKTALITGITGQDGSYLAEFLLSKGYVVHGLIRRASTFNTQRLEHLYQDPHSPETRLFLHYGDLSDSSQLTNLIYEIHPEEIYHLGAQSHVLVSFDMPEFTGDITGLGTIRILEAIRKSGIRCRFYQASSSELFGDAPAPQNEKTPFRPRSPYAAAKLYSYWMVRTYREGYRLFASNGIMFNHECVTANTPVLIRRNGMIDFVEIADIVPHRTDPRHGLRYTTIPTEETEVWDGGRWTRITAMTANWNDPGKPNGKRVRRICARGAVLAATDAHVCFRKGGEEVRCGDLKLGDHLELKDLPSPASETNLTENEAWLLGAMVAEGWVDGEDGKANFTNQDSKYVEQMASTWRQVTGEWSSPYEAKSGFPRGGSVLQLRLQGAPEYNRWLAQSIYTRSGEKRVPLRILNAPKAIQLVFLRGYNAGDGLQAGHGDYEFESFKTKSAILAAGFFWLANATLKQRAIVCVEVRDGQPYYQINLNSPDPSLGGKGQHLKRPSEEIVKIQELTEPGWLFDLATESGTFSAGVGFGWIHNSPRRGETFVSRKITRATAMILAKKQEKLYVGNLEARRDWGFAPEYVVGMWQMLQQDEPLDLVFGTGETHSVSEFAQEAFGYVHLDWKRFVELDARYLRPTEVESLRADPAEAKRQLGWEPLVKFRDLVRIMMDSELEAQGLPSPGEGKRLLADGRFSWLKRP